MGMVMKEYVIPVHGLKTGIHNYEFEVDQTFFESFDYEALENPSIQVKLKLEKTSSMLLLHFIAEGEAEMMCDRCGQSMIRKIACDDKAIVKFGEEKMDEADEIIVLSPQEHELDVSGRIYEMLILNLPQKTVHESIADCDQEALKRLENYKEEKKNQTDPRWDALKKLK